MSRMPSRSASVVAWTVKGVLYLPLQPAQNGAMPELPEVEAIRRKLESVLVGKRIEAAKAADDPIVLQKVAPSVLEKALVGKKVVAAKRKGKFWWLELEDGQALCG